MSYFYFPANTEGKMNIPEGFKFVGFEPKKEEPTTQNQIEIENDKEPIDE